MRPNQRDRHALYCRASRGRWRPTSLVFMTSKSDRRAAREAVAAFHEAQLAGLVAHVGSAVDGFRSGQMDAFDVDQVLFQYARAAKELWKFCNLSDPEFVARLIRDRELMDWWELGAPIESVERVTSKRLERISRSALT